MKKNWNLLQRIGLLLVAVSCVLLLGSRVLACWNGRAVENLVAQMKAVLPEITEGDPENYSDTAMPVLQLEGKDFSGLIQVPAFGVSLPMGSSWGRGTVYRYPCRFWGSVYDHSLIAGGSGRKGQFDFCSRLDLGEKILVTDMTGVRFSYEVTGIDRRNHADMEVFREKDSDLILFTQDSASQSYLIVRCSFAPYAQ